MSILQSIWLCLTGKSKPSQPNPSLQNPFQQKPFHQDQPCYNKEAVHDKTALILDIHENQVQAQPSLVIAIHGDVPFGPVGYHNRFAKKLSDASVNVVSVGLLRPGYKDDKGRRSAGRKGWSVGDNYDHKRIEQIALAIRALQQKYKPSKTIVAGHSGGAAITAKMLGYYPSLIDTAFIVSCPTHINEWRDHMFKLSFNPLFIGKLNRVSPFQLIDKISSHVHVHVFCGVNDPITPAYFSECYVTRGC
ncbi:alpha/beta hydrolase [uncultured Shewanella sp.]|uniref:alpha/beta hydrolase n=1 Tax=uncultured Shewanella sp. TaxID=173975 RepID=UPI00260DA635|nr:alpha/beta hydrolase [uncultured Shewanella sp.]